MEMKKCVLVGGTGVPVPQPQLKAALLRPPVAARWTSLNKARFVIEVLRHRMAR